MSLYMEASHILSTASHIGDNASLKLLDNLPDPFAPPSEMSTSTLVFHLISHRMFFCVIMMRRMIALNSYSCTWKSRLFILQVSLYANNCVRISSPFSS